MAGKGNSKEETEHSCLQHPLLGSQNLRLVESLTTDIGAVFSSVLKSSLGTFHPSTNARSTVAVFYRLENSDKMFTNISSPWLNSEASDAEVEHIAASSAPSGVFPDTGHPSGPLTSLGCRRKMLTALPRAAGRLGLTARPVSQTLRDMR
jgi:hypothetical protein